MTPATIASAVRGERHEPYGLVCRVDAGRAIYDKATSRPENQFLTKLTRAVAWQFAIVGIPMVLIGLLVAFCTPAGTGLPVRP
jgi:hypothetical protein